MLLFAGTWKALAADELTAAGLVASGKTPVRYIDRNGVEQECTDYTNLSAFTPEGLSTIQNGWYALDKDMDFKGRSMTVSGSDVNIILCDGKKLDSIQIVVEQGNMLKIWGQKRQTGKIKAQGTTDHAGIGAGTSKSCGNIYINGGDIEARGGTNAAGIGGGYKTDGGYVEVKGGTVRAYGAKADTWFASAGAPGIGGGYRGNGQIVRISGGKVYAYGAEAAAGIGGSASPSSSSSYEYPPTAGSITIDGGKVEAYGGIYGAGIGGGFGGTYGSIIIKGGNVKAEAGVVRNDPYGGDVGAAGIGGGHGQNKDGTLIRITGGDVTATGRGGAGIGGGSGRTGSTIQITGGTIVAISGASGARCNGAGIGGGVAGSGGNISISGGHVIAIATGAGAGIGGGSTGSGGNITISGGEVFGIADWNRFSSETYMKANHYKRAKDHSDFAPIIFDALSSMLADYLFSHDEAGAGIGGGYRGNGGAVNIKGGYVIAMSSLDGIPAIGKGIKGDDNGSLTMFGTAMVKAGKGNKGELSVEDVKAGNRVSACRTNTYAAIGPCTHNGGTLASNDWETHRVESCEWCTPVSETRVLHEFDPDTHACRCGHKQYKLTFSKTGEGNAFLSEGAIQDGESVWIPERKNFSATVWPGSPELAAAISATSKSGGTTTALSPTYSGYEIDQETGMRVETHRYDMPSADVELKAAIAQGVVISFEKGDKEAMYTMNSVTWVPNTKYTVPQPLFGAPYGKKFVGWKTEGNSNLLQPGEEITISSNITLIAQWEWKNVYNVWVGATQVNETNKDNVLGDGKVSYDPTTTTLTLNGLESVSGTNGGDALIWADGIDLTVKGTGDVVPESGTVAKYGIRVSDSRMLTVSGDIKAQGTDYGLYAVNYVAIPKKAVNIEAIGAIAPVYSGRRIQLGKGIRITTPENAKLARDGRSILNPDGSEATDTAIIQHQHEWGEWTVVTPATETEAGQEKRTCSLCDAFEVRSIHENHAVHYIPEKEPGCFENGHIAHYQCEVCHKFFEDEDALVELDEKDVIIESRHSWDDGEIEVEPSCTTEGTMLYTCTRGDGYTREEAISPRGHSAGDWKKSEKVPATCTNPGYCYDVLRCGACNEILTSRLVSVKPLGHEWEKWFDVEEPTCTMAGEEILICKHDYSHIQVRDVDPKGHTQGEAQVENEKKADCEHGGSYDEVVYCNECNEELSRTQKKTAALEHAWSDPAYVWAANDKVVTAERHCTTCAKSETETVKTSSRVTKKPTAKKPGKATVTAAFKNPAFTTQTKVNDVKKSQKIKAKKNVKKAFRVSKQAKALSSKKTVKLKKVAKVSAKTAVRYKKVNKVGGKKITVNPKTGKVTLKKGLKTGTYKVKVKLTARASKVYKAAKARTITLKVIVKA